MGVFNLGNVIGAFDRGRDPIQMSKSQDVFDTIRFQLFPNYKAASTANIDDIDKYAAGIAAGTPEAQRFANLDKDTIGKLIDQSVGYDPASTYNAIRDADLASLDKQFGNLVNYGSATDKANAAALGLGGRASAGSFGRIQDQVRAARNLSPILNTIYGNLGSNYSRVATDRYNNMLNTLGLMSERAGIQDRMAGRALLPAQARTENLINEIAGLKGLSDVFNQNIAGYRENVSGLGRWANAGRAVDDSLNSALDIVLSLFGGGGGMGGGGGGGLGGLMSLFGGGGGRGGGIPYGSAGGF